MADHDQLKMEAFDFSQEAMDFMVSLWQKLKTYASMALQEEPDGLEALEDDDLEWVNAAGMIDLGREDDPFS